MKLLCLQFSPVIHNFLRLKAKYLSNSLWINKNIFNLPVSQMLALLTTTLFISHGWCLHYAVILSRDSIWSHTAARDEAQMQQMELFWQPCLVATHMFWLGCVAGCLLKPHTLRHYKGKHVVLHRISRCMSRVDRVKLSVCLLGSLVKRIRFDSPWLRKCACSVI